MEDIHRQLSRSGGLCHQVSIIFFFFKISICLVPFVVSVNNRSEKLHGSIIVVVLIQYNTCRDSQRQD